VITIPKKKVCNFVGGEVSPLLANIALHGLQTAIEQAFPAPPRKHPYTGERLDDARRYQWKPKGIIYADDFVILHQDLRAIEEAKYIAQTWLGRMGLRLKEQKTRITHTLSRVLGTPGFDFLGFNIRQYEQGKRRYRHVRHGIKTFRPFIKPRKAAQHAHSKTLSQLIRSMRASPQADLIARLNPVITGWANYHAIGLAKELPRMDQGLFQQLQRWARRRHPKRHWKWVAKKYWHARGGSKWVFCTPNHAAVLTRHARHVNRPRPVRDGSPFDGDWAYWSSRLGRHPGIPPSIAHLMRKQDGKCPYCGLYFTSEAVLEKDHMIPVSRGGSRRMENIQLLHAPGHDVKTAQDMAGCTTDKD
jgi:RNA-directed DNA polymerase